MVKPIKAINVIDINPVIIIDSIGDISKYFLHIIIQVDKIPIMINGRIYDALIKAQQLKFIIKRIKIKLLIRPIMVIADNIIIMVTGGYPHLKNK